MGEWIGGLVHARVRGPTPICQLQGRVASSGPPARLPLTSSSTRLDPPFFSSCLLAAAQSFFSSQAPS